MILVLIDKKPGREVNTKIDLVRSKKIERTDNWHLTENKAPKRDQLLGLVQVFSQL